ncbi:MAG TPA: hypothetical protein VK131_09580 [Candidatus Acidoferrales bacterium]|nr:hypothetical protein [Candidatus Acidoferrales bacterium]
MIGLALLVIGLLTWSAISSFDGRSLAALAVVLVGAAAGGIGFSWKRYSSRQ